MKGPMYSMGEPQRLLPSFNRRSYAGKVVNGQFERAKVWNLNDLSEEDQRALWADMQEDWQRRAAGLTEKVEYQRFRNKEEQFAKAERIVSQMQEEAAHQEEDRGRRVQEMKQWLRRKESEARQKKAKDAEAVQAVLEADQRRAEALQRAEEHRQMQNARRAEVRRRQMEKLEVDASAASDAGSSARDDYTHNDDNDEELTRYLPIFVHDVRVLTSEDDQTYRADNSVVQNTGPGLGFRVSKNIEDKDGRFLTWGAVISGIDDGDGWIRCEVKGSCLDAQVDANEQNPEQGGGISRSASSGSKHVDRAELGKLARRRPDLPRYAHHMEQALGSYASSGRPPSAAAVAARLRPRSASIGVAKPRPHSAVVSSQARPNTAGMTRSLSAGAQRSTQIGCARPESRGGDGLRSAGMPRQNSASVLRPRSANMTGQGSFGAQAARNRPPSAAEKPPMPP